MIIPLIVAIIVCAIFIWIMENVSPFNCNIQYGKPEGIWLGLTYLILCIVPFVVSFNFTRALLS